MRIIEQDRIDLCGRKVTRIYNLDFRERDQFNNEMTSMRCADCGNKASYLIIEDDGEAWPYCGICEIGG